MGLAGQWESIGEEARSADTAGAGTGLTINEDVITFVFEDDMEVRSVHVLCGVRIDSLLLCGGEAGVTFFLHMDSLSSGQLLHRSAESSPP